MEAWNQSPACGRPGIKALGTLSFERPITPLSLDLVVGSMQASWLRAVAAVRSIRLMVALGCLLARSIGDCITLSREVNGFCTASLSLYDILSSLSPTTFQKDLLNYQPVPERRKAKPAPHTCLVAANSCPLQHTPLKTLRDGHLQDAMRCLSRSDFCSATPPLRLDTPLSERLQEFCAHFAYEKLLSDYRCN